MVKFGAFYFDADEIAAIKRDKSGDASFPERVLIVAKHNNQSYSMNFRNVETAEWEMRNIAKQIERDRYSHLEKIQSNISLVLQYLKSLETRQRRILRVLRKLPGTNPAEIDAALEG
ncbi:MAG: hypothetical protein J6J18_09010 [Oscillospiraceae bacterium]|nr:hypothetical protein [Oscillospiraceae bacterium]